MLSLHIEWRGSDDIHRTIEMVIEGASGSYGLTISGSASKDYAEPRVRRWKTEFIDRREPIFKNNGQGFIDTLRGYADKISAWTEGDLSRDVMLPPRPRGVTPNMVSGPYVP